MQEQAADVQRLAQLKIGAKLADERWAAKAKYIERPKPAATIALAGDPEVTRIEAEYHPKQPAQAGKMKNHVDSNEDQLRKANETATNPGATWMPEAWSPGAPKR
jgi:NADH dehydrogenase [ubiquinone] 1 alpha subcomplex assembly factor 2